MKLKLGRATLIISGVFLLLIAFGIALFGVSQPPQLPQPECHEEQVQMMNVQQVANLFSEPLIELTWLPQDIQARASVSTYAGFSSCQISVVYHEVDRPSHTNGLVTLRIQSMNVIELTKMPENCQWGFDYSGPTGSNCYLSVDSANKTLRLRIDFDDVFDPETILQIIDGIRVVEPSG